MLNFSKNSTTTMKSFYELLNSWGFYPYKEVIATYVLPVINILGVVFCSLSLFIFWKKTFAHPSFFYYRLLCLVYIIHLAHNIPRGILYSPRYFPKINTYLNSWYQVYYSYISASLFQYEDLLQIGILLDRITMFSSWVKKYFAPWTPRKVSFSFFIACFLFNLPYGFSLEVISLGDTYHIDESNGSKFTFTLYFFDRSAFSKSPIGMILIGFTSIIINLILTLVFGITLNIVSVYFYNSYLKQRTLRNYALRKSVADSSTLASRQEFTSIERCNHKAERNMFFMALTLCSLFIFSRFIFFCLYVCFFIFGLNTTVVPSFVIMYSVYTLLPTVAIFVFYSFNKIFRKELKNIFFIN
jgi:hypothetical protein